MPELPEVETVVHDLRPRLVGRRILSVEVGKHSLRRPWSPEWEAHLLNRLICAVRRRGKWILLDLDNGSRLVVHLGMTGQLTVAPASLPRADHTHVVFSLSKGKQQLRFRDVRRFGSMTLFDEQAHLDLFFHESRLGPEPFELEPKYWRKCLAATSRCLKAVLLDQRVVAGVGNIYADESLFQARLHPAQLGRTTRPAEAERLRQAVVTVLTRAIEQRGSSIRDYVGGTGLKGKYQDEFRVYGRVGEPCPRCRTLIERIRLAGRSTHYCPKCQRRSV